MGVVDAVGREVDADVWRAHAETAAEDYNDDRTYKRLMAEAIDAKAWALHKVDIFADGLLGPSQCDAAALDRILAAPVRRFADRRVAWQLRTGYEDFPWTDVMEGRARVDLGQWRPAGADAAKLQLVRDAFASNSNLLAVIVAGHELALGAGVCTRALDLRGGGSGGAAAKAAPDVVAFLISVLDRLEALDLRYARLQLLHHSPTAYDRSLRPRITLHLFHRGPGPQEWRFGPQIQTRCSEHPWPLILIA